MLLYQVMHPWHWLTYGQNASVVGLIVLIFYTIYTRRMMLVAQQTRRAELYPLLILQDTQMPAGYLELVIVNVGGGPLLNASCWGQPVSEKFSLGETFVERPASIQSQFAGTLVIQGTLILSTQITGAEHQVLEVVEGNDSIGGRHQFCFLRRCVRDGNYEHAVRMIHPTEFLPVWHRATLKMFEWRARLKDRLRSPH